MKEGRELKTKLYKLVVNTFGESNADELLEKFLDESRELNPSGCVSRSYAYIAMRRYIEKYPDLTEDLEANA